MTRQKTIDILAYFATGFTFAQAIICLIIISDFRSYRNISYHYSDGLTWYFILFLVPFIAGLSFYLWLKSKTIPKEFKKLMKALLAFQVAFTLIVPTINYIKWGYVFKRPTVFSEVLSVKKILTSSAVSNIDSTGIKPLHLVTDTTKSIDYLRKRKDYYYANLDRIFMVFQDRVQTHSNLYDFPEIYNNPKSKASEALLLSIDLQIKESKLIDKGKKGWDTSGKLKGIIIEFITENNDKYVFAGLNGGQVSNDHYPFYEFLFIEKDNHYELIKKQRFYTDYAGKEGLEYAIITPFISLLLSIGMIISSYVGRGHALALRMRK